MILKRKKTRSARVGDFCLIKKDVKLKMFSDPFYEENSASFHAKTNNMFMSINIGKKLLFADFDLLYISNKSPWPGIVEVIPLCIHEDNVSGAGVKILLSKNKKYFIRLESLSFISPSSARSIMNSRYSYRVASYCHSVITNFNKYNIRNFSWENK